MAAASRTASEPRYFCAKPMVPKLCSADPKGPATSSKDIRGHISVLAAMKFTYFLFLIKGAMLCQK